MGSGKRIGATGRAGAAFGHVAIGGGDVASGIAGELAGIAALTSRISGEPLQQGLRHVLDFLLHATVADAGEAFLAEPHGRGLVRTCHRGRFGRAFAQVWRFDPSQGFPGLVLAEGQPLYTDHLAEDFRFLRTQVKRRGLNTYVCSPLTSRSRALGCLALAFRRSDVDLERVLNLLRWVATPTGLVVDTLLAQQRDQVVAVLRGVGGDPDGRRPQALQALLQEMVHVSAADAGELYLPSQDTGLRWVAPVAGAPPRCPVLRTGTIGSCPSFGTGTSAILYGRRAAWPLACRGAPNPGGAWCCIPIACDGESFGMLRLLYRHVRQSPPNESIALIERLAVLTAEMLRDARDQLARAARADAALHAWLQRQVAEPGAPGGTQARARRCVASDPAGEARLQIRCFGSLELSVDGTRLAPAAIRRKRVLTLLAILLTYRDQPQCKDALIEMLWPGADPDVRTRQFHVLVHELRRTLEPHTRTGDWLYVRNRADRYVFDTRAPCWIDAVQFHTLLELGHRAEAAHEEQAAIDAYEAAVELYRGDYLQDDPFAEWCWPARERLREACLGALHRLTVLWGGQRRWDRSVAWSRRALLLDPLREEMHRALMHALWAAGRRDEAVRQYETCAHLLRERLDLTPLPETEQLVARIRATPRPPSAH